MCRKKKILISLICALAALAVCFVVLFFCLEDSITVTVADTLPMGNGQKATVIILAGQSNASGCSLDEYLEKNVSEEKYKEYKNGYDNVYINYQSGFKSSGGFVRCTTEQGELDGCFGPELGMAEKLNELYPNETFYIIKCAWGGTNLFEQWLSPSSDGKTGENYKYFTAFVDASIEYLESKDYDVKIEGMCWMQGESDSFSVEASTMYGEHLSNLIDDVRDRYSDYEAEDGIAFIDAYISDNPMYWVYCDNVNACKDEVEKLSPMNSLIDTIKGGLICTEEPEENPDIPHYDSLSEIKLGHLFASEIAKYLDVK